MAGEAISMRQPSGIPANALSNLFMTGGLLVRSFSEAVVDDLDMRLIITRLYLDTQVKMKRVGLAHHFRHLAIYLIFATIVAYHAGEI
jgi:hypothetical protein